MINSTLFINLFLPFIFLIIIILIQKSSSKDMEIKWEVAIITGVLLADIIILTNIKAYNDSIQYYSQMERFLKNVEPFNMWQVLLSIYTPSIATIFGGIAYLNYKRKSNVNFQIIPERVHITDGIGTKLIKLDILNLKDRPLIIQGIIINIENISIHFPLTNMKIIGNYTIESVSSNHIKYFSHHTLEEFSNGQNPFHPVYKLIDWRAKERLSFDNIFNPAYKNMFIFEKIKKLECTIEVETLQGCYLLTPDRQSKSFTIKKEISKIEYKKHILTSVDTKEYDNITQHGEISFIDFCTTSDGYEITHNTTKKT